MLNDFIAIACEASELVRRIYEDGACAALTKGDGSPVTRADGEAEALILARLGALFPDLPVAAEEQTSAHGARECGARFVLVDPLDGTREFISRNGEFTVNIALIENGAPVLGVVTAPAMGLIFAGETSAGARMGKLVEGRAGDWRAIACRAAPAGGLDALVSRSHLSPETAEFMKRFPIAREVSAGSSLKFCRVAEGAADLYPRLGTTMEWDTAAGDAVLRAAGGSVSTLDGRPLTYGKPAKDGVAAFTNPWFIAAGRFDPFQYRAA